MNGRRQSCSQRNAENPNPEKKGSTQTKIPQKQSPSCEQPLGCISRRHLIEQPVDEIVTQLRAEVDIERASHHTSSPESRDVRRPLPNWDATVNISVDEPRILETVTNWDSDSDSADSDDSTFFFFRHFFNAAEIATLTQNMKDALQQAGQNNTTALLTGM